MPGGDPEMTGEAPQEVEPVEGGGAPQRAVPQIGWAQLRLGSERMFLVEDRVHRFKPGQPRAELFRSALAERVDTAEASVDLPG